MLLLINKALVFSLKKRLSGGYKIPIYSVLQVVAGGSGPIKGIAKERAIITGKWPMKGGQKAPTS
ncbi:hypothetical protein A6B38_00225 [Bartonella bacilliformis]|nr:hypothetical protein AL467_06320 [Bartonella bacilliformis]KZN22135.1 hypothetical protein A6B38_00225 [Bartonella bacilliformis]